ncbi:MULTISPECIES: tyrosine-type recombinase/integrase [Aerococcus]|uniref:Site-specific integrase n=4 Tax=Lactobacillales TaxID=186826 RepID=A0A329NBN6_9LACT|nr:MULTISPECIES: tyrosine-type recombinase/integrase [Aerococcus]MDL5183582.1 tyrosine-type recombinase/integrase [Aerococcus mictus]KAA9238418.1 site-specific integrase [Aerococcus urinae]KAA9299531.1 site-specific integrase [Aerococcus tenax]MDK6291401.1 tyrosine-type recombinase/integrase [Aerococcus urinae]MDK6372410.1 tyrosine-type recombinase/integrase [Aerococcus urinae]
MIKQYTNSKGTFWEVRHYLGKDSETNKDVRLSKRGFKTKKQAQDYLKQEQYKFDSGLSSPIDKNLTVNQLYQEWLEQYRLDVEESTLRNTETYFKLHILPAFGDIKINQLKTSTIQKEVNVWYRKFQKHRKIFNYLKRLLNYGINMRYLTVNPCDTVIIPKKKLSYNCPTRDRDFYTKEELSMIMLALEEKAPLKWLCFFRLLAYAGLRRGEALGLQWQDISFKECTISVKRALKRRKQGLYIGATKNKPSVRTIDIDQETLAILKKWRTSQQEYFLKLGYNILDSKTFLFRKEKKNFPISDSSPRNFFFKFCQKNGLPYVNIHGFRHTHCSLLFEAGVSMNDVKDRLGHGDIQTTMNVYAHVTPTARKEASQRFAKFMEIR